MTFLEIIGGIGSGASISGFSLKDLIAYVNGPDKNELETYFTFLEGRRVLVTPFDQEVTQAVIKSLESTKDETERCRLRLKSEMTRYFLLELITTLSKQLMILYKYQGSNNVFCFIRLFRWLGLNLRGFYVCCVLRTR